MASQSQSYTENAYSSYKSTWTLILTGYDLTVTAEGQNVKLAAPTLQAKYVNSNKSYGGVILIGNVYANGINMGFFRKEKLSSSGYRVKMTSGTYYTIADSSNTFPTTAMNQIAASRLFNSSNPTVKAIPITAISAPDAAEGSIWLESGCNASSEKNNSTYRYNMYPGGNYPTISWGTIGYIYYKCPPVINSAVMSKSTADGYWKDVTVVSVDVSASAKYGGNIAKTKLTIGDQSVEINGAGTLQLTVNAEGTFTPVVTVTDSRDQVATKTLADITVQAHSVGVSNLTAQRIDDATAALDDEGTNALLTTTFERTVFSGNYLLKPTVKIAGVETNAITWYTGYTDGGGFTGPVNWSNYSPAGSVTLYGKMTSTFSTLSSYFISVTPKTTYDTGADIGATLAQSFHLLVDRAGGKGLGIGMKPKGDALYLALDLLMSIDTAAAAGTPDGDLFDAIDAKGWAADLISSSILDVKALLAKLTNFIIAGTYVYNGARVTQFSFTDPSVSGKERIICGTQDAGNPVLRAEISGSTITVYLSGEVTLMRVNYICF